jgi:hypothetical protein
MRTLPKTKHTIRVITNLPNSEQSSKGKVKTHKYIHRKNQSAIGKLYHENSSRNKTYHTMRTVPKTKHNIP